MRAKEKCGTEAGEARFELKYCQRCGVLWVRPVGGEEIYCLGCGREMAELPPPSYRAETARMPRGPRWSTQEGEFVGYEECVALDPDAPGGVA